MLAARLRSKENLLVVEAPAPTPGPGEVRVKLRYIGVCGTDAHLFKGERAAPADLIIGHEGFGAIDAVGADVDPNRIGERIAIEPNFPCGSCVTCAKGHGAVCPNKRSIGVTETGCLAHYAVVPSNFAWSVPDELDDLNAALIEPSAVAYHAFRKANLRAGQSIFVLGLGAIGLLLTQIARAFDVEVYASDLSPQKMALGEKLGARPVAPALDAASRTTMAGQLADISNLSAVMECAGGAHTLGLAIEIAPRGSSVVMVGLATSPLQLTPIDVIRRGISLIPSLIYEHPRDFPETIDLIASGRIRPAEIVSNIYTLPEAATAIARTASGDETKALVRIV